MNQVYSQEEKDFAKEQNISKSYARKVLGGELSLEEVRERIRLQNQPLKNKGLRYMLKHLKAQTPFVFATYNGDLSGTIKKVRKFDFHISDQNGKAMRRVKKLEVKFFYKSEFEEDIMDLMKIKPVLRQEQLQPVLKREERYPLDHKLLEKYLKERKTIKIMLRGGEIFSGTLRWVSDFESKLQLDEKVAVVFLHHALYDLSVVGK